MKQKITLLFICALSFAWTTVHSQIYVKHDASGAENGTSWADAFTQLQDAINAANKGDQIWVAAGTYLPPNTGDVTESYFRLPYDMELYGGFAGTESNLEERNWETQVTELSGDHLGDDVDDDFDANKTDNSLHVMWLTDTITNATVIDGFTIRNGNTEPSSSSGELRRGGGILTYGAPIVRNCVFTQNFGHFGGGIYPRGSGAAGVLIRHCRFINNSGGLGAGIYVNSTTATIDSSFFQGNSTTSLGGAIYNGTSAGAVINQCNFIQNVSVDSRAGGIYCTSTPSTITNCYFERNRAPGSTGGAIHVRNSDDTDPHVTVWITDCVFDRNQANWGGALGVYDKQCAAQVVRCTFEGNSSAVAGGATTNGFGAQSTYTDCVFNDNTSNLGGANFNQNDSAFLSFVNCTYMDNSANERGGVMHLIGDNEPGTSQPLSLISIEKCMLVGNTALEQGGALNVSNVDLNIERSLFIYNFLINSDSRGGAISFNTSDSLETNFYINGSTFTQNSGTLGAGISNWIADSTGSSTLTLVNNIFHNPDGEDYEIEAGEPEVVSEGGNLSSDNSLAAYLTADYDTMNINPGFVDEALDFHLKDDSPCVNTGIDLDGTATDIEGNPIVGRTDKGAYENQIVVAVRDYAKLDFGWLNVYPNPVQNEVFYSIENDWKGDIEVSLFDANGRQIINQKHSKTSTDFSSTFNVGDLPSGYYLLRVSNGDKRSVRKIMKR